MLITVSEVHKIIHRASTAYTLEIFFSTLKFFNIYENFIAYILIISAF